MLRAVGDGLYRAELLEKQLAEEKQKNSQLQRRLDSIISLHRKQIMDIQRL